jgi:hypothetical protein
MPSQPLVESPPLVALAGWVLPGAGHWLVGERTRAIVIGATILGLFLLGLLLAGVRVIEVPGYDDAGGPVILTSTGQKITSPRDKPAGSWALASASGVVSEIANKPWFVPQALAGPAAFLSAKFSIDAARQGVARSHARVLEIGVLYTAIAGMLNLLAVIDAADRAGRAQAGGGNRQGERA